MTGTVEPRGTDEPAPRIRFAEMADSALVFSVLCWIELPELRGQCVDGLNTAIYKALNAEGITIPFPQRDVHLYPDTAPTPTQRSPPTARKR